MYLFVHIRKDKPITYVRTAQTIVWEDDSIFVVGRNKSIALDFEHKESSVIQT